MRARLHTNALELYIGLLVLDIGHGHCIAICRDNYYFLRLRCYSACSQIPVLKEEQNHGETPPKVRAWQQSSALARICRGCQVRQSSCAVLPMASLRHPRQLRAPCCCNESIDLKSCAIGGLVGVFP